MGHRVNDDIGQESRGIGGISLRIGRVISPFEPVAQIGVPGHQHADSAVLVEDCEDFGYLPGWPIFPLIALRTFGNSVIRDLNDLVDVVEGMK